MNDGMSSVCAWADPLWYAHRATSVCGAINVRLTASCPKCVNFQFMCQLSSSHFPPRWVDRMDANDEEGNEKINHLRVMHVCNWSELPMRNRQRTSAFAAVKILPSSRGMNSRKWMASTRGFWQQKMHLFFSVDSLKSLFVFPHQWLCARLSITHCPTSNILQKEVVTVSGRKRKHKIKRKFTESNTEQWALNFGNVSFCPPPIQFQFPFWMRLVARKRRIQQTANNCFCFDCRRRKENSRHGANCIRNSTGPSPAKCSLLDK